MYTITVTIGAFFRRKIRRTLRPLDEVTFTEDKGLLDSQFVVQTASKVRYDQLIDYFNELHDRARGAL